MKQVVIEQKKDRRYTNIGFKKSIGISNRNAEYHQLAQNEDKKKLLKQELVSREIKTSISKHIS
jgi:hypothetical protein